MSDYKADIFQIINLIYTEHSFEWIYGCFEDVNGIVLFKWLSMDDSTLKYIKDAEPILYHLSPLQQLIYLHSLIPKRPKAPFIKYIKSPKEKTDDLDEFWEKIRIYLQFSDTELERAKPALLKEIQKDWKYWLKELGMPEKIIKKYSK